MPPANDVDGNNEVDETYTEEMTAPDGGESYINNNMGSGRS